MKKVGYIVGAGLVIGGAAAIYVLNRKRTAREENVFYRDSEKETSAEGEEALTETAPKQQETTYGDAKSQAVGNMYTRHTDAAEVMKNSVDTICENTKTSEKTNYEIDAISAELDEIMGKN